MLDRSSCEDPEDEPFPGGEAGLPAGGEDDARHGPPQHHQTAGPVQQGAAHAHGHGVHAARWVEYLCIIVYA